MRTLDLFFFHPDILGIFSSFFSSLIFSVASYSHRCKYDSGIILRSRIDLRHFDVYFIGLLLSYFCIRTELICQKKPNEAMKKRLFRVTEANMSLKSFGADKVDLEIFYGLNAGLFLCMLCRIVFFSTRKT